MIRQGLYTQLVPMEILKSAVAKKADRKALMVYLILRYKGLDRAGHVFNHMQILTEEYNIPESTAYRIMRTLISKGWVTKGAKAIKVTSIHKLKKTKNRQAGKIKIEWLKDFSTFTDGLILVLTNNYISRTFRAQKIDRDQSEKNELCDSDSRYKSFNTQEALTTEAVIAKAIGINQAVFNTWKKRAKKRGWINFRCYEDRSMRFTSKEQALNYLSSAGKNCKLIQFSGIYYITLGTVINILDTLLVTSYSINL